MKYPGPQAYNEALQMSRVSILDTVLRSGRVETDSLGLPFGRTGSFAITFKIAAGGSYYAFRCFLQNRATIHERYDAISSELKSIRLPYFVDFTYLDEGIRVDNTVLPTVRMSWAAGMPLGLYLQDHHTDTGRMTALQQQIQGMALALGAAGLAHGDIQGGNLLIGEGGEIKLVDYDGMYVPSIADLGAIETGHPNFQHPERASSKPFDEKVDQFSFALLHTVIAALIERPNLWSKLNSDSDKFLLGESDIANPFSSPAFAALTQLPATGSFAKSLQAIASAPYAQVPAFTDFLNHRNIPTSRASTRTKQSGPSHTASSSAAWYADHIHDGALTSRGVASGDALGNYLSDNHVVDAKKSYEWAGGDSGGIEVIGRVERTDVGEAGRDLPYVRLVVCNGNPELTIDVWSAALRGFAEQGITIDDSWEGQWISARGTVQGPIGSPTGERYSMTVTGPQQLERINVQQARWRLSSQGVSYAKSTLSKTQNNLDTLDALSSSRKPQSPNPSGSQPPGTRTSSSSIWTSTVFWLTLVAIGILLIGLLAFWASDESVGHTEEQRFRSAEPASSYQTCVESNGIETKCFKNLQWVYKECWESAHRVRLEHYQTEIREWQTARRLIAEENNCGQSKPWTVSFVAQEESLGTQIYRLYRPADAKSTSFIQELTVTVTRKVQR